jgi:hypothetical protein
MNWDAIGAISEAAGAVGVIITLGYLAMQIRRNNLLATAESNRFAHTVSAPTTLPIAQDPDTARVFQEGLADRDALSANDRVRFDMLMGTMVGNYSTTIVDQRILGQPDLSAGFEGTHRTLLQAPGGASWWVAHQSGFASAHRSVIERVPKAYKSPAV